MPDTGTVFQNELPDRPEQALIVGKDVGSEPNRGNGNESSAGRRGGGARPPAPSGDKRHRNQNAELRLVDQQPQKTAGKHRPPVKKSETSAEQGRRPGSISSGDEIDKDRRRRQRQQERAPFRHRHAQRAIKRVPSGAEPNRETRNVGHERQRRGQHQHRRRVAVVIVHQMAADDAVLEGVEGAEVVALRRALVPGEIKSPTRNDKIVSERPFYSVRQAVAGLSQ